MIIIIIIMYKNLREYLNIIATEKVTVSHFNNLKRIVCFFLIFIYIFLNNFVSIILYKICYRV